MWRNHISKFGRYNERTTELIETEYLWMIPAEPCKVKYHLEKA
jgi:hypothetical protein